MSSNNLQICQNSKFGEHIRSKVLYFICVQRSANVSIIGNFISHHLVFWSSTWPYKKIVHY